MPQIFGFLWERGERLLVSLLLTLVMVLALASPAFAATAGFAGDIEARITGSYFGSNALGTPAFEFSRIGRNRLTQGTTTQKADKVYAAQPTIAASGSTNYDLAGVLTDPFGVTLTFVKVKAIYIKASASNTNSVCYGGASANAFLGPFSDATDIQCVPPGGIALVTAPAAGWTVTAATADILKVANSGGTTGVTFDFIIVGTGS